MRELNDRQEAIRAIAQAESWARPTIARQRRRRKGRVERLWARLLSLVLRPARRD